MDRRAAVQEAQHDLVVIGAGPGGYVAAIRGAQLGLNTACVEKEPTLGGTCLRIGCIPSKALLESSERFWQARHHFGVHGIECSGLKLNLPTLLRRKDQVVSTLVKGVETLLKQNKITRYTGHARLNGRDIEMAGSDGARRLRAKHIIIATGSKPSVLPGVVLDHDRIGTSTAALNYGGVPEHLVVIGGGYIGLELGSVWKRLGARVTVLEFLDRILPGMDAELSADAQKIFGKQGLEFRLGTKVTAAKVQGDKCVVECANAEPLECDRVLMAGGRTPCTEDLGLESAGVERDGRGNIRVDKHFATTAPGVYAIGDVIGGAMLAHKAEEEGVACVEGIVTGYGHVNYATIPGVVYTQPEIAAVGQTEEQLKESGIPYRKGVFPLRANGRALASGDAEGKVKVLADARTDRVLGVHIIASHAGELINEAAAAMNFGASSEDLARSCHAHPTLGEALKEACLACDERAIHFPPAKKERPSSAASATG